MMSTEMFHIIMLKIVLIFNMSIGWLLMIEKIVTKHSYADLKTRKTKFSWQHV